MAKQRHQLHTHFGGWLPEKDDPAEVQADVTGLDVPESSDLRPHFGAVYNQRRLGSCTAQMAAGHMQMDMHLDGLPLTKHRPSRLFIYYIERMLEGNLEDGDTGAFVRDGYRALADYGWVMERLWPYIIRKYEQRPPADLWELAKTQLLEKPHKLVPRSRDVFKAVFANKQAIGLGFQVYDSFDTSEVA